MNEIIKEKQNISERKQELLKLNDSAVNSSTMNLNDSNTALKEESKNQNVTQQIQLRIPRNLHNRVRSSGTSDLGMTFHSNNILQNDRQILQRQLNNETTLTSSIFSGRNLTSGLHFRNRSFNKPQDPQINTNNNFGQPSPSNGFLSGIMSLGSTMNFQKSQRGTNQLVQNEAPGFQPNLLNQQVSRVSGGVFKFGDSSIMHKMTARRNIKSIVNSKVNSIQNSRQNSARNSSRYNSARMSKEPVCRICLEKLGSEIVLQTTASNPDSAICDPCKCAGSIKYIHKECLKRWIQQRKCVECELCHNQYSEEWVKWASDNNLRFNPNEPTQFEMQVQQFNLKYKYSKIIILMMALILLVTVITETLQQPLRFTINIYVARLIEFVAIFAIIFTLILWRFYLQKMTNELVKDQMNINISILHIDSASLLNEIERYRGYTHFNSFTPQLNDLLEKRLSQKTQVTTSLQTQTNINGANNLQHYLFNSANNSGQSQQYNQVGLSSMYSLPTNSNNTPSKQQNKNQSTYSVGETFGDVNRLTLITQDEVHDIFADEEMPKFHQFRNDEEEQKVATNHINLNSSKNISKITVGAIPPVRKIIQ
eukprot:403353042